MKTSLLFLHTTQVVGAMVVAATVEVTAAQIMMGIRYRRIVLAVEVLVVVVVVVVVVAAGKVVVKEEEEVTTPTLIQCQSKSEDTARPKQTKHLQMTMVLLLDEDGGQVGGQVEDATTGEDEEEEVTMAKTARDQINMYITETQAANHLMVSSLKQTHTAMK
jgi:hypothetical protein